MSRSRSAFWGGLFLVLGMLFSIAVRQGWIDLGGFIARTFLSEDSEADAVIDRMARMARENPIEIEELDMDELVDSTPTDAPAAPVFGLAASSDRSESEEETYELTEAMKASGNVSGRGGIFRVFFIQQGTDGGTRATSTLAGRIIFQSGIMRLTTQSLNNLLVLPTDVPIVVKRCGVANAFYQPSTRSITLCDELFYWMTNIFSRYHKGNDLRDAILGATLFIVFHEVGHALIHLYDAPVLAAEEDAADALATVLLSVTGLSKAAFNGAQSFSYMARARDQNASLPFWSEHSLDEQRFFNILCYLYADDPGRYAFLVAYRLLPLDRAQVCPSRYAQTRRATARILGPHLRR